MTIFLAVWHLHSFSINYELSVLNYEEPSLDELAGRVFGQHQVQTHMLERVRSRMHLCLGHGVGS